jgi:hypothetical protein
MPKLNDWADIATIVTGMVAVVALFVASDQIKDSRRSQREATSATLYGEYLSLAIQYPRLAGLQVDEAVVADLAGEELERYEWFVSFALHAFERILVVSKDDKTWREVIRDQLRYHSPYLSSQKFEEKLYQHYSAPLRELIDSVTG